MRFKDKVVLVTGSSRGMGRAIALRFGEEGANTVLCCRDRLDLLKEVSDDICGDSIALQMDVTDLKSVEYVVDAAVEKFGGIDILINNAGNFKTSTVKRMDEASWRSVIDVNLTGTFNCTKAILNKTKANRIINISSVVAQIGVAGAANYAAAKSGVLGFTKSVAKEVVRKGITVNALVSGYIDTGMWTRLPVELQGKVLEQIPMNRPGKTDEITETVLFLASEGAGYITGQSINVNGGIYM